VSSHDRSTTAIPAGTASYIDVILADLLFADPTYQRDLDPKRVTKMVSEFDQRLVGVLEVSARGNGRFAILDGQHRWAATCRAHPYRTNAHLACQIHTGLSVEEEARLYYELDTKRKNLSWWERWRARRGTGDPGVLAIEEVLNRHRLQVHPSAIDGNLRATKAIETIVTQLGDLQMLDNVLVVLTSAYGRAFDAYDGALMQGVALVLGHYDLAELDLDRLVVQLADVPPRQLRARAASMREAHRGTLPRLCAAVIVERYNSARGAGRLEEFFTRVPSTSKAGTTYNRGKRQRAEIRRWAQRNGHDLTGLRSIPPSVRRAYEEAQVAALATAPDPIAGGIEDTRDATGSVGDSAATSGYYGDELVDGIDERTRLQIVQAYAAGATVASVKTTFNISFEAARALRDDAA
jgi:hypothetical protein